MTNRRHFLIVGALAAPLVALAPPTPALAQVHEDTSECVAIDGASAGDTAIVNITPTRAEGTGYGAVRAEGSVGGTRSL